MRYLLACHLAFSYSDSQVIYALRLAREEAERVGGPVTKRPFIVTGNGPFFTARKFVEFIREPYSYVRTQYRTPQQLGLLERFHKTLKIEEVYWRLYENPQHAPAMSARVPNLLQIESSGFRIDRTEHVLLAQGLRRYWTKWREVTIQPKSFGGIV